MSEFYKMKGRIMDALSKACAYYVCVRGADSCPNNMDCDECTLAELEKFIELCKKEGKDE